MDKMSQEMDPVKLLSSKNFNDIVNVIIFRLGSFREELKNDIRQACSLAVLKSIENYNPEKNDKFWVYAMPLMTEYAKNELNLHKNIIHIPYNRLNSGYKNYENVSYSYSQITFDNGSEMPFYTTDCDMCTIMDLQKAIDSLGNPTSDIVKMRIGLKATINGKNDFTSIGMSVNMPMHKARNLFISSKKKLCKYLKPYAVNN